MPTDIPIAERCMDFGGVDKEYMEHYTERKITDAQWLYMLEYWSDSFNDALQYALEDCGGDKVDDAIEEFKGEFTAVEEYDDEVAKEKKEKTEWNEKIQNYRKDKKKYHMLL